MPNCNQGLSIKRNNSHLIPVLCSVFNLSVFYTTDENVYMLNFFQTTISITIYSTAGLYTDRLKIFAKLCQIACKHSNFFLRYRNKVFLNTYIFIAVHGNWFFLNPVSQMDASTHPHMHTHIYIHTYKHAYLHTTHTRIKVKDNSWSAYKAYPYTIYGWNIRILYNYQIQIHCHSTEVATTTDMCMYNCTYIHSSD